MKVRKIVAATAVIITLAVPQLLSAQASESEEPQEHYLKVKFDVELYGFIKLDMAYDNARVNAGNFARWVEAEDQNEDDDQFNITANQSRFGLMFSGPSTPSLKTSGRLEIDFYGGGAENKSNPMLRHVYLQLDWPERHFSLLAGQTFDVISPLTPNTLNYTVAWWAGNIGYRRPQLRLTQELGNSTNLVLQIAATRTIGDTGGFSPGDTGEDSGFPTAQGRMALVFPLMSKKATIGVSGHYGEEEYDFDATGSDMHYLSWSGNVEISLPLGKWLAFQSELFYGANLDDYFGGVGNGVNTGQQNEVVAYGGWADIELGPFGKWKLSLGASMDDPDDDDLNPGSRSFNTAYWGNVVYNVNKAVQAGIEGSYWYTEYKFGDHSDAVRVQTSFIYKF